FRGYTPEEIDVAAIWGSGPNDVWAGSHFGKVMHWDGARWAVFDQTFATIRLWGSGSDDVWGVTNNADTLEHWDGHRWSVVQLPSGTIGVPQGISGIAANDIWLTGTLGEQRILHYDGMNWGSVWINGDLRSPTAIWVGARNDGWVVGANGLALHWNDVV